MVNHSTRSWAKSEVCALWGIFDLKNWSAWTLGRTSCIAKFLTDVDKKMSAILMWEIWITNKDGEI